MKRVKSKSSGEALRAAHQIAVDFVPYVVARQQQAAGPALNINHSVTLEMARLAREHPELIPGLQNAGRFTRRDGPRDGNGNGIPDECGGGSEPKGSERGPAVAP